MGNTINWDSLYVVDVTIKVIAADEDHALKIVRDKFAKYKYEKECSE